MVINIMLFWKLLYHYFSLLKRFIFGIHMPQGVPGAVRSFTLLDNSAINGKFIFAWSVLVVCGCSSIAIVKVRWFIFDGDVLYLWWFWGANYRPNCLKTHHWSEAHHMLRGHIMGGHSVLCKSITNCTLSFWDIFLKNKITWNCMCCKNLPDNIEKWFQALISVCTHNVCYVQKLIWDIPLMCRVKWCFLGSLHVSKLWSTIKQCGTYRCDGQWQITSDLVINIFSVTRTPWQDEEIEEFA